MYLVTIYLQNKTDIIMRYMNYLMFLAPSIVTQSRNINQRNAHFSNKYFNSIFGIFGTFRTFRVHQQEDSF
jgi:hypothetical protein